MYKTCFSLTRLLSWRQKPRVEEFLEAVKLAMLRRHSPGGAVIAFAGRVGIMVSLCLLVIHASPQ